MKHLKLFEDKREPQVGDYIITIYNNIQCEIIGFQVGVAYPYVCIYLDGGEQISYRLTEIEFFGTKEDCDIYLQSRKYNL